MGTDFGSSAVGRCPARAAARLDHRAGIPTRERATQKNGPQSLSHSRDDLSSKLPVVADARGRFVRARLPDHADQFADAPQLPYSTG